MNLKTWAESVTKARNLVDERAEHPLMWVGWAGGDHVFKDSEDRFFVIDLVLKTSTFEFDSPKITAVFREGKVVSV